MGHDIDIVATLVREDKVVTNGKSDSTYMSFNWGGLRSLCPVHGVEDCPETPEGEGENTDCKDKRIPLWHVGSDCHGMFGQEINQRAQNALNLLKDHGVVPGEPDENNNNWGWGCASSQSDSGPLPRKERLGVFAYHIQRFQKLGESYPSHLFISDQCPELETVTVRGEELPLIGYNSSDSDDGDNSDEDDSDDNNGEESGPVTYFRHPLKGTFRVHNYETAMEVYNIAVKNEDSAAERWLNLALMMPDAPKS